MKQKAIEAQFCVVGGGLAGICAAVAAAREGVQTVLLHDRPVLGGNASSWIISKQTAPGRAQENFSMPVSGWSNCRWKSSALLSN